MRRLSQPWMSLGVCLSFMGLLCLGGCDSPTDQATAEEVTNRAFAFADGAVFHASLANQPTTLLFLDNARRFMLFSADRSVQVTGSNRFGSCDLTVTRNDSGGNGPQVNEQIVLNPCNFDSDNSTLMVSNRGITMTSAMAIARVVEVSASDVQNRSFLFTSGAVFDAALDNEVTTLSFNGNASEFTLVTSTGSTTGSATGVVQFSPCVLQVRSSTYGANRLQPGSAITLSVCRFNGGNRSLILSSDTGAGLSI